MAILKRSGTLLLFLAVLLTTVSSVYAGRNLVVIETNLGDITVELYQDKAPVTVDNFLSYVDDGFYTNTIFHRVDSDENHVAQAGMYDPNLYEVDFSQYSISNIFNMTDPNNGYKVPGEPIELETTATALKNLQYTIGMARLSSPKNSATSQFYFNFQHNTDFDGKYAVFGIVIDGFDVVDSMKGVEVFEDPDDDTSVTNYDHITAYLKNVPVTPIVISRIYRSQDFDDDDSSDFTDVEYLKATSGGIRTYILENYVPTGDSDPYIDGAYWNYEFSTDTVLGVKCLKWRTDTQNLVTEVTDKTYYLARNPDGEIYVFKEVNNEESSSSKQVIFEATNLLEARPISYYANYLMQFRLIAGTFDPTNLGSANNKIILGSGSSTETQEIISLDGTLAPNYSNNDVVIVKKYRGLTGSETGIEYFYYHKDDGLILYLQDEDQILNGIGWWLDEKIFNSTSTDFSDVPFLRLDKGFAFTRTILGKGDRDNTNFTQSISYPTSKFNGVNYVTWIQNGIPQEGIRNFELHMARDTNGVIWVFYYKTDLQVIHDFDTLTEAVKLETLANDYVLFALISGVYDNEDVDSPDNFYTRNEGGITINEKIVAFDSTLSHIPVSQNHLVKVKRWEGNLADEDENNIWYFSPRVGLMRNYRNGETGADGDGWQTAFYGGLFKDDLNDMSDTEFLKAAAGSTKLYYGSKDYADKDITMSFNNQTVGGLKALRWISTKTGVTTNLFDIQLVRDNLDRLWVLRYRINGVQDLYVGSASDAYLDAKPLSDYTGKNMLFKLICGDYDSELPYDPENEDTFVNKIAYTQDSKAITEEIVSFNASLPEIPYYNDDLVLVKYQCPSDPNDLVRWKYYHKDDGLVREIFASDNTTDNITDVNSYRLAWASKAKPSFTTASSDFSSVQFIYAKPGTYKLMQGQGKYENLSYEVQYRLANHLGVQCLEVYTDMSNIEDINTIESLYIARDSVGLTNWILRNTINDQVIFEAQTVDQAVPFERWPDLRWQMCSEDKVIGDSFSWDNATKTIIDDNVKISQRASLGKTLFVLKHTWDPTGTVDGYTYLSKGEGEVLKLTDNFINSEEPDPNYDDTSTIQTADADGFWQVEEEALDDLEIKLNASKNRTPGRISDSFSLSGEFKLAADAFVGKPLTFTVGQWSTTIDTTSSSFKKLSNTKYSYKATLEDGGRLKLVLDLYRDTFKLDASRIDLSGTVKPIQVTMGAGGKLYQNPATVTGKMPIYFNTGLYDTLEFTSYKRKWRDSRVNDQIWVNGGITATSNIDLTKIKTLKLQWGTSDSLEIDVKYIKRSGNRNRYYYSNNLAKVFRKVNIDWDNSSFQVYMVKNSLSAPPQTLTITITDSNGTAIYQQSTQVQ